MIGTKEVRSLLEENCGLAESLPMELLDKTDEEFLKVNLSEYGYDSLDYIDFIIKIVKIENYDDVKFQNSDFSKEQTVENLIKLCNEMSK